MAKKKQTPNLSFQEMMDGMMYLDEELKKQGFPPEDIGLIQYVVMTRMDKLDFTNQEAFMASFEKLLPEVFSEMEKIFPEEGEESAAKKEETDEDETPNYPRYLMRKDVQKYTIRIALKGISPTIWRKLEVPSNISLAFLGTLLIEAMGWENYHLHQFISGSHFYSPSDQQEPDMFPDFGRVVNHKSEEYCLSDLLWQKGDKVGFEYDFGDSWLHQISLSAVADYAEGERHLVRLIGGKNACPPEDCGGVWGYEALCRYYYTGKRDKNFDKEFFSYVDDSFDPEYYPLNEMKEYVFRMN